MVDEAKVTYRAVATFVSLARAARQARKDLESIRKEEAKTNAASVAGSKKVAQGHRDATKALRSRTTSTKTFTRALLEQNKALQQNLALTKQSGNAAQQAAAKINTAASVTKQAAKANNDLKTEHEGVSKTAGAASEAESKFANAVREAASRARSGGRDFRRHRKDLADINDEQRRFIPLSGRVRSGASGVLNTFRRLGNWRPRWIPPFVALIPLIAGLLALLNPLVAILGAVSAAAFAAGSSLLSIGGAAVALVPMISAAVAAVASLVVAFQGIGGVFSKWSQVKNAASGGGSGKSAADQAYDLLRAQERLSDAQERATDAQDNLNEARRTAIRRLEDLRRAVQRANIDEASAAANAQQALENYYDIMADPGSTAGDKASALADLLDAQQSVIDQQQEATRNAEDLADAEAKGVEQSDEVIAANRELRNSLREVRDAQVALTKVQEGAGGGGGASALNDFNKALAKLSPSARAVVLALIGMQGAWENVQRSIQESFFSEVVDDMGRLESMLPSIENLLGKAAGAMGRLVSNFIKLISSPEWKSDLEIISDGNVKLIDQAGRAVLALAGAWKDLIIAAGPFAENVLKSFADLSESFERIVANARETGSLAAWLDKVYLRIQQWWRIVKNVAATLWNYGAAAGEFGQWITDGLESMTDNWLKASEEARKQDSPFKQWLEDVKPLLSEIKGLFGDFFSWLSSTAMSREAIDNAQEILGIIRDKLGPALSNLFDSLNKSGIGQAFVDALSSIVESISKIVANGGAEGFKNFFDIIDGFFQAIADFSGSSAGQWFISQIIPALGVLAGITFVGQFTGLFALFGWLLNLAGNPLVMKLLQGLGGLVGIGGTASGVATTAAGTSVVTGAAGTTAATGAAGGGLLAGAKGLLGGVGKAGLVGLIVAGLIQSIGSIASVGGSAVSNISDAASGKQSWEQASSNMQHDSAAAMGPPGIGVLTGLIDSVFGTQINESWADLMDWFQDFLQGVFENVGNWFNENLIQPVSTWFFENVIVPFQNFINGLISWWNVNVGGPMIQLFGTIREIWETRILPAWNTLVSWVQTNIFTPIALAWNNMVLWVQTNVFTPIANGFNAAIAWIQTNVFAPIGGFFASVANWIRTNVFAPIGGFFQSVASWIQTNVFQPIGSAFTATASWIQTNIFTPIKNAFDGVVTNIKSAFDAIRNFNPITAFNNWLRNTFKLPGSAIGGYVAKGVQYLAAGGNVRRVGDSRYNMDPKGTDTVPSMLTPGEYVVKRERVDEVGPENMQAFNDGLLSFAGLMSKKKYGKGDSGVGYFNGGGLASYSSSAYSTTSSGLEALGKTMVDESMNFGDIHIHYPKRERASESLPRAIRSVAYQGGRRKNSERLEKVND